MWKRSLNILSLYDRSGRMVEPWVDAGHFCTIIDIEETRCENPYVTAIQADLRNWKPNIPEYDVVFGFPPCTDLAVSGARWFKTKAAKNPSFQEEALELFDKVFEIGRLVNAKVIMAENPISVISTKRRKPNYKFHPYEFAGYLDNPELEAYKKTTCLWTEGEFIFPERKAVSPRDYSEMLKFSPGPERQYLRSLTPNGFARAVYEAHKHLQ